MSKQSDIEFGFREKVGGPGIKGTRQKRLDQIRETMFTAVACAILGVAAGICFPMPWALILSIPLILLAVGLGLFNVLRIYRDERQWMRDVDHGRIPDDEGVTYDSYSQRVRDTERYGYGDTREF